MRVTGPRDTGQDRAGADHVAGLEVLEHEHEVSFPRVASLLFKTLATAHNLRRNDVAVGGKVDEMNHLREFEQRRDVLGRDLTDDKHACASYQPSI